MLQCTKQIHSLKYGLWQHQRSPRRLPAAREGNHSSRACTQPVDTASLLPKSPPITLSGPSFPLSTPLSHSLLLQNHLLHFQISTALGKPSDKLYRNKSSLNFLSYLFLTIGLYAGQKCYETYRHFFVLVQHL